VARVGIVVSVLTGLAAVLHPVIAVLVVLFFTESNFYMFDVMLRGYMDSSGGTPAIRMLEYAIRAVYSVLPMLSPFESHTRAVEGSLRVTAKDWMYLGATAGYALTVFSFWFLFADYRLRRRVLN
jgi:hypothetical protein